ncbi:hypothetical protein IT409_02340 [Candidatus Falkowbacteria bacterium]|nr:hypothetical protein [Candidatus Falkowbacteria bacterium]
MKKILLLIITIAILAPLNSQAQPIAGDQGLLTGLDCVSDGNCQICDIMIVANNIIKVILGLSGSIALLACLISGGYLLISQGGEYKKKAYETAKTALIGLAIIFFAYPLVNLGLNIVTGSADITEPAKVFGSQAWTDFCK